MTRINGPQQLKYTDAAGEIKQDMGHGGESTGCS